MQFGIDYFGFVYVWFNRTALNIGKHDKRWTGKKHPILYVGSHLGSYDDGYICSSKWMKASYLRYPSNFIRRIVYWQKTNNEKELREMESKWINLIPEGQLGKKYYNLARNTKGLSCERAKSKATKRWSDPEQKEKWLASMKDRKKPIATPTKGRVRPNVTAANLARTPIHCERCDLHVAPNLYARWHGDKCLFTPEKVTQIKELHTQGKSFREIGRLFNTNHNKISNLLVL